MQKQSYKGHIVDVVNQNIFDGEIQVENGKIAHINHLPSLPSESPYIMPGFIDSHIHIESSMVTPRQFAQAAMRHGTVGVVADPHEIANVCGEDGINFMINSAKGLPFHFCWGLPSCVPALGGETETAGCTIDARMTDELLKRPDISFLAEMMNFPGVVNGDKEVMSKISSAQKYGKPIDGHSPLLSGDDLKKYIQAGISTDHECQSPDEAIERMQQGMKILVREGTAAKNFDSLEPLITDWYQQMMFCSDDIHPQELSQGHINLLVKKAISRGHQLMKVLTMACVNPVKHYHMATGLLQEGDSADFIVVANLTDFNVLHTVLQGDQTLTIPEDNATITVPNNFKALPLQSIPTASSIDNRAIVAFDGSLFTDSTSNFDDSNKIVVVNRYAPSAQPAVGYIKGFTFTDGAIAQSIAHDCHNIIAIGSDDASILRAINQVIEMKGGMAACHGNQIFTLPLPVAGLMSLSDVDTVAHSYATLLHTAHQAGSRMHDPFLTLSFMALPVIPRLKITDRGLFSL